MQDVRIRSRFPNSAGVPYQSSGSLTCWITSALFLEDNRDHERYEKNENCTQSHPLASEPLKPAIEQIAATAGAIDDRGYAKAFDRLVDELFCLDDRGSS